MKKWYLTSLSSVVIFLSIIVIFGQPHIKQSVTTTFHTTFSENYEKEDSNTEIILLGDVMLGRTVMSTSLDKNDPNYPWHKVADKLAYADIVFANLEHPIIENCPRRTDGLIFCADPRMAEGLVYAGVDVVSLANNHSYNHGESGVVETKKILLDNEIEYTLESLSVIEKNGLTFGFLGFEFIDRDIDAKHITMIESLSREVDVLIVGIHWGVEYKDTASSKQRSIAQKVASAGVDLIVGHHPHWVQDMETLVTPDERYVPVYYSLGNFIFDQMWSEETKKGLAIKITFDGEGSIVNEEKMPVYMSQWAQPQWVE